MTTTTVRPLVLKTVIGSYGHTKALKDGTLTSDRIQFDHTEVEPVHDVFPRIVRGNASEFDVSELAITTYLLARSYGKPITGLPIVLARSFPQNNIVYNVKSGIKEPKDLEGRRVGVRAYGQTAGVWARGFLQTEYGVRLDKVQWVLVEEEHVQEFQPPVSVERILDRTPATIGSQGKGVSNLQEMLLSGEIDAMIAAPPDSPDVKRLIPDPQTAARRWYEQKGIYPINHMLVVKDALLEEHPWLAEALFSAFKSAKAAYFKRLAEQGPSSREDEEVVRRREMIGGDPLPYGFAANRKAVEAVIQFAYDQHMLPRTFAPEELFAPSTLNLE